MKFLGYCDWQNDSHGNAVHSKLGQCAQNIFSLWVMAELDGCGAEVICPDFLETGTEHDFSQKLFLQILLNLHSTSNDDQCIVPCP